MQRMNASSGQAAVQNVGQKELSLIPTGVKGSAENADSSLKTTL